MLTSPLRCYRVHSSLSLPQTVTDRHSPQAKTLWSSMPLSHPTPESWPLLPSDCTQSPTASPHFQSHRPSQATHLSAGPAQPNQAPVLGAAGGTPSGCSGTSPSAPTARISLRSKFKSFPGPIWPRMHLTSSSHLNGSVWSSSLLSAPPTCQSHLRALELAVFPIWRNILPKLCAAGFLPFCQVLPL